MLISAAWAMVGSRSMRWIRSGSPAGRDVDSVVAEEHNDAIENRFGWRLPTTATETP